MIKFELPALPASPNETAGKHWTARAKLIAQWRSDAHLLASAVRPNDGPWDRVAISMTFYLPDHRRRDPGNLLASIELKGALDGLVDARVITDDSVREIVEYGPFTFEYRAGRPGLLLRIVKK